MYIFNLSDSKIFINKNNKNIIDFDFNKIKNKKAVVFNSLELPDNWRILPQWCVVNDNFKNNKNIKNNGEFIDLRQVWHKFGYDEFLRAGGAKQFAEWFLTAKLCSCCGGELEPNNHDTGRHCVKCGRHFYVPISPAIIVAVTRDNKILLAHNNAMIDGLFSVIAGFVEPGETLEHAVEREVHEEVAVNIKNIKYFGSQPWPFPQSLMIGFTAEYDEDNAKEIQPDGVEIGEAGWFSADEIKNNFKNIKIPDGSSIARRLIENFIKNN